RKTISTKMTSPEAIRHTICTAASPAATPSPTRSVRDRDGSTASVVVIFPVGGTSLILNGTVYPPTDW
ncbi:MAG: hypothetical protein QOD50_997, partial [Actinomycetota bacterium]|nr:hypothetical protein [Actinomycetota bacterium]